MSIIEVLGVTLPWKDIFAHEGPGARFYELLDHREPNPFLSSLDMNPFSDADLGKEKVVVPAQQDASANLWVDLLTGDHLPSESISQPVMPNGEAISKVTSADDKSPLVGGTQQYINCYKLLAGPHMGNKLGFMEAMKLEIERLHLNLSAADRDRALLSIGVDPATINPNLLLEDEAYMGRLCRVANTLAMLGQASTEDSTTASIGLEPIDGSVIDFWNIARMGKAVQVHAEAGIAANASPSLASSVSSQSSFLCYQCERKVCKICCAGRGALLLEGYTSNMASSYSGGSNQGGSVHGSSVDASLNRSTTLDGFICKLCCHPIVLDALTLDYVRVLVSIRRSARAEIAVHRAVGHVIGFPSRDFLKRNQSLDRQESARALRQLLNGEESLAEFPFASFLHSVETAAVSAPYLSLLTPLDPGLKPSYWRAPPGASHVEFVIVLGDLSDVSGVILLVSPCGYSMADAPTQSFSWFRREMGRQLPAVFFVIIRCRILCKIWASNKIHKEERSCMGKWDMRSMITSSSELSGPENLSEKAVPRHIKFAFRNPVRCRIIWIMLSLQKLNSSRGSPVRKDMDLASSQGSDQINSRSWLERVPQLNRFKVPVEAERLTDNDLVLEQYLSPASPLLAGFRLDGFSAIRPRATHSPPSDVNLWDSSSTFLDNRQITPAVLYIQVSAFQGYA
ncbi:unnamed protein product [Thlaspi arvense]|uniref:Uncharacterized protein n=1 Tax=Thlaspi arvense TaxID=13288 RepID=A0AAU9RMH8_THLAR|nr:unnamed protein product [Thlaspi arvense]